MAEPTSKADLLRLGFGGYAGWTDEAAIMADYRATGGQGKRDISASQAAGYNPPMTQQDIYEQQLRLRQEANKPAVASYEASLPEITQKYTTERTRLGGEKQPLLDRYQNLIGELKGRETKETATQAQALAQTFGRRGLTTEGGLYQGALAERTGDISQFYGGQIKETTLAQEADVRDIRNQIAQLTEQRVTSERDVRNMIAQLQSQGASEAITQSLQQFQFQQDQALRQKIADFQQQQATRESAFQQRQFEQISLPESQLSIQNLLSQIANRGPTAGVSSNNPARV